MEYIYEVSLNDLKDLKHVEWFLIHRNEYEFVSSRAKKLLDSLLYKIQKKNIFYSEIVNEYNELVSLFENNPFNYQYNVLEIDDNKGMESKNTYNYFIVVNDKERNKYKVAYQYVLDNPIEHDTNIIKAIFDVKLAKDRSDVVLNFDIVDLHYQRYLNSGVKDALNRYSKVQFGKDYHLLSKCLQFVLYNFLLFKIIHEAQYINVITHFWQYFSNDALYSVYNVFNGHKILGLIALLLITYFIYLDIYYIYGLYYIMFVKRKYDYVYKHYNEVIQLYNIFSKDWQDSRINKLNMHLSKVNHRENVYIRLIKKVSCRYNFYEERSFKNLKTGKREKKKGIIDVKVPRSIFYTHSMNKQFFWLVCLLIFVEAICNVTMIIQYF